MRDKFYEQLESMVKGDQPFAIASVVEVIGSASAKPGSKAIISADGENRIGWVGGGCAESLIINESLKAINSRKPKMIEVDLDDEIFGLGMPCGGHMRVFIEPVFSRLKVAVSDSGSEIDKFLLREAGLIIVDHQPDVHYSKILRANTSLSDSEQAVVDVAAFLSALRGSDFKTLSQISPESLKPSERFKERKILIIGHSQISQNLARLAAFCEWTCRVSAPNLFNYPEQVQMEKQTYHEVKFNNDEIVVIASHHKGDLECLERAIQVESPYVGLVASRSRAQLVYDRLPNKYRAHNRSTVISAPAGLNIKGEGPFDIALSIFAELCQLIN